MLVTAAHDSISVPSTPKCSFDSSRASRALRTIRRMSLRATFASISRSRLFVNVEWSQIGSSIDSPTNQRNSRL